MTPQLSLQLRLENEGLTPDAARKTSLAAAAATTEELRVAYVACQLEGDHSDRERRARELLTACGMIEIATAVAVPVASKPTKINPRVPRPDQRAIVTQAPVVGGELSAVDLRAFAETFHKARLAAEYENIGCGDEAIALKFFDALRADGFKVSR